MSSAEDEPDDMVFGLEGKSMYTAQTRGDGQKTLQPESGKPNNAITEPENSKPRRGRVPDELRKNKNLDKYYEPKAVSIGPLHHGNIKISRTEGHKSKLENLFIQEFGLNKSKSYNMIKTQIDTLKRCYVEEDIKRVNTDDLASKFLSDGCSLLHCICYAANGKLNDLKIGLDMEAFSQHDLFLLENQLPYQVLDIIMKNTADGSANIKNLIDMFIDKTARDIRGPSFGETGSPTAPQQSTPAHLLELLWKRLVDFEEEKTNNGQNWKGKMKTGKQQVRKVNEQKAAGIQFKSETKGSLRDISFVPHRFTGTLMLPSLVIDDSTAPKLWNLIAFEMCPDFRNDFQVISSYISFLDSLINQPNDVKELRKAHILHNALESDADVTRLIKEIGPHLDSIPEAYFEVKDSIQKHCEKKWNTWINLLCSPWTLFAVVAAVAVLIMSFSSRLGAPRNLST